jgi:hypothetical protein
MNFSFSRWNSGYQGAFHELFFSQWNSSYQGAFSRTFLFHDGILAIKEPFHELFSFTMEFWLSRSLFTNFSFSQWNSGYQGAFHTIKITKCTNWGETLFIYITKSIYKRPASLKTLPLDLEPPLQRKEYGPSYSNEIAKRKENVFVPEITYRFVIRVLFF